ncbi:MAG: response regulator transcription factor [Propionibacterium sp.]|nr:response regulator transcription factor [Propionibacterium sp.]
MRVLIAEDQFLLRDGLSRMLQALGNEVVAVVQTASELRRALLTEDVDVAIVDVRLPPTFTDEGLRIAIEARRKRPGLPVLVLSQYVETLYARELMEDRHGGVGYLLKDRVLNGDQFLDAVQQVATGGTWLDPEVVARILGRRTGRPPLDRLTPREIETLTHMAQGKTNAAIAKAMFVTEKAIAKNVNNIFDKLRLTPSGDDNRRVIAVLQYLEATDPDTSPQPQATG